MVARRGDRNFGDTFWGRGALARDRAARDVRPRPAGCNRAAAAEITTALESAGGESETSVTGSKSGWPDLFSLASTGLVSQSFFLTTVAHRSAQRYSPVAGFVPPEYRPCGSQRPTTLS